jgi:GntR family transcriptional regulator
MLSIDHRSALPLHAQVESLLRRLIRQPEYQNGALLPDEVRLATELGVSRGTVRLGVTKLVHEGLIERKAGVGTRVCNSHVESGIRAWRSFSREMASKGITVENFHLKYRLVEIKPAVAAALQLDGRQRVWQLERVRGWNRKPVLRTLSWFHPRLGLKGDETFARPLYEILEERSGIRPHHARESFTAVTSDTVESRLLQTPKGTPLLLRRHTVFDAGGRPFEYAEVRYVSSRFELTLDLKRGE